MATKKELIQFFINNRTQCSYDLPLFQSNVYSINATTQYLWNITGQNLSCGTGGIFINGVYYTFTYTPSSLQALLEALNALGFGFFCYQILEGQTYIYTTDDVNIYNNLDLCFNSPTTTTTSTTSTSTSSTTTLTSSTTSTTSTTSTSTSTSSTTSTTTITTSTTTTTTTIPATIQLGSPSCRFNNCNDNAFCRVIYNINTTNAPAGSYITIQIDPPPSGAVVSIYNNSPTAGQLSYAEPDGLQSAVFFTLQLRDSGGNIIASSSTSLAHQSFWNTLPLCGTTTTTTSTSTTSTTTSTSSTTTTTTITTSTTTTTTTLAPNCFLYVNNTGSAWVGDFISCGGELFWGVTLPNGSQLCAQENSPTPNTLTKSTYCGSPTTSTTTTTTTLAPSIQLGSPSCRFNLCNDNAECSVIYNINTTNAPVGSYITIQTDPPPSGASVVIYNNNHASGQLRYSEPNGLQSAVFFTLQLRNSSGVVIASSSTSLAHQSFWNLLPICGTTTTSTTTSTTTAASTTSTSTTSTSTTNTTSSTTTSSTTSTTTITTSTTTTTTTQPPTISLGTASCRFDSCSDFILATCRVLYGINTTNAPAGAYITVSITNPPSGASVSIYNNSPTAGVLQYTEPDPTQPPVFFTLELRNSAGVIIATSSNNIVHQSSWSSLPLCGTTTTTTSTTSTSTTTSTTTIAPSIQLGSPSCRFNNCNDNAECSVIYNINTTNAPVGSYITIQTDPPPSGATVVIYNNNPASGQLRYTQPNGLQGAVFFTLQLRNSSGVVIATSSTSLAFQSFWQFLSVCSTTTSTTSTTTTISPNPININIKMRESGRLLRWELIYVPPPYTAGVSTFGQLNAGTSYQTVTTIPAYSRISSLVIQTVTNPFDGNIEFGVGVESYTGYCGNITPYVNNNQNGDVNANVNTSGGSVILCPYGSTTTTSTTTTTTTSAPTTSSTSTTTSTTSTSTTITTSTTTTTTTLSTNCFLYRNNTLLQWVGTYTDCGGNSYSVTLNPFDQICALAGSPSPSGLTPTQNCGLTSTTTSTTTTTTTVAPTTTTSTTSTSTTITTSTTTTTTTLLPTIQLGSASCRFNQCNDNATCAVLYNINTTNAPAGAYITVQTDPPPVLTASVSIYANNPVGGLLRYDEQNGVHGAVFFTLQLRNSSGVVIATSSTSLNHQTFWTFLPLCGGN